MSTDHLIALLFQTLAFGLAVGLAAVRVLVRDVGELIRAVMQLWTWTLPIVYPEQLVPEQFRAYLLLNPPYAYIRSIRSVVLENTMPEPHFIIAMIGWPAVALFCSSMVMGRLRSQIKDAL